MARLLLPALALISLAIGCGPKAPTHNGYKKKRTKPWTKAKSVSFDEANEAEIDGKVNWAKRRRARWYALNVPKFGDIEVTVRADQIGGAESEEEFDLAFDIINESGKVLVFADKEEDDAGEEVRTRKLAELEPGIYWIHVYLQSRMDAASFNIRVKFEPGEAPDESNFPAEVAYVGNLPAVPPVDDAPPPIVKRPKCKGKNCKRRPPKPPKATGKSVKARLTSMSASGGRVRIQIGVGSNRGVVKGAKGRVINSAGKGIQGGSFTVTKVTKTRSWGSVSASLDAVNSAKYARIKVTAPPEE